MSGNVQAVDPVAPQIDVGDQRSIISFGCIKQLDRVFARRRYYYVKSAVGKAFFDHALNKLASSTTKITGSSSTSTLPDAVHKCHEDIKRQRDFSSERYV